MTDEKHTSPNNQENTTQNSGNTFFSSVFTFFFWFSVISIVLWNWDGFWQTDIKFLNKVQKQSFSTKYSEEQLKVSRITRNNNLIDDINKRVDKVVRDKEKAISQLDRVKAELKRYREVENTKCRYLDSSLRMIDHLIKKYSDDELKRVLTCTNEECEKILNERRKVIAICT